jgi:hypothetical protein
VGGDFGLTRSLGVLRCRQSYVQIVFFRQFEYELLDRIYENIKRIHSIKSAFEVVVATLLSCTCLQGNENNFLSLDQCRAACQVTADMPRPTRLSSQPARPPLLLPAAQPEPLFDLASCRLPPDSGTERAKHKIG